MTHNIGDKTNKEGIEERFSNPDFVDGLKILFTYYPGQDHRVALKKAYKLGVFILQVNSCSEIDGLNRTSAYVLRRKTEDMYRSDFIKYAREIYREVTRKTGSNFSGENFSARR